MRAKQLLTAVIVLMTFTALTFSFSSCQKNSCADKVCLNGGYCNSGICNCPTGFSGPNCENDNRPACQRNNTGDIRFNSYSSNPYDCYVNSVYVGRVSGYGLLTVSRTPGYCSLRTLQVSGYVLYPSEYTGSGTLSQCSSLTFNFP